MLKQHLFYALIIVGMISCAKEGKFGDDQQDHFVKFYGTSSYDQGFQVQQTSDGGYVILGNTTTPGRGTDISLIKTDAFGNEVWRRTFGDTGDDEGKSFEIDASGGFVITGFISRVNSEGDATDRDVCLIKTNSSGILVWNEPIIFGDSGVNEEGRAIAINDQGYFIGAITDKEVVIIDSNVTNVINQSGEQDMQVIQTDFNGALTQNILTRGRAGNDVVNDILIINDEVILIGHTQLGNRTRAFPTVLLASLKIGANGFNSAEYNRTIDGQTEVSVGAIVKDGDLILLNNITTSSGNSSIEIVALIPDKTYITKWSNILQIDNASTTGSAIILTDDNEFIVAGTVEKEGGDRDIVLLKLDAEGNQKWQQTYGSPNQNEQGECILQTPDGGYVTLGTLGLASDGSRIRNSTITLIRTDSEGGLK